jgi:hypothetical protein
VVFDLNQPVITREVLNTIDSLPPTSRVNPSLAVQRSSTFRVEWAGDDNGSTGSGIRGFSIFVSKDGGPFAPFLLDITNTSAVYQGEPGHTYAFYSVATDNVGNRESNHAQADTSTTIQQVAVTSTTSSSPTTQSTTSGTTSESSVITTATGNSTRGPPPPLLQYVTAGAVIVFVGLVLAVIIVRRRKAVV